MPPLSENTQYENLTPLADLRACVHKSCPDHRCLKK